MMLRLGIFFLLFTFTLTGKGQLRRPPIAPQLPTRQMGGHVGNGGGGLLCQGRAEPYVLDTFELERQHVPLIELDYVSREDLIDRISTRLLALKPLLPVNLKLRLEHLPQMLFVDSAAIGSVDTWERKPIRIWSLDTGGREFNEPQGCRYVQLAICYVSTQGQNENIADITNIEINQKYFPLLNTRHKRILELHELFYSIGYFEYGNVDSVLTHHLLSALLKKDVSRSELLHAYSNWASGFARE